MATSLADIMTGYLYDTVTSLNNMDFFNKVVQFDDDPNNVASSDATFLFAGPPVLNPKNGWGGVKTGVNTALTVNDAGAITNSNLGGIMKYLKPIGAVQQYSLNQGRQIIPFTELGSRLKRQVVGSGMYNASMARVVTRSSNLKASLYSWLPAFIKGEITKSSSTPSILLGMAPSVIWEKQDTLGTKRPWEHYNWIGMESEIYNIPFGLLAITGSAGGESIHVEYLERCYMPAVSNGYSAGNPMIVSNVQIMVTRPVPFVDGIGNNLIPRELLLKKTNKDGFSLEDFTPANMGGS